MQLNYNQHQRQYLRKSENLVPKGTTFRRHTRQKVIVKFVYINITANNATHIAVYAVSATISSQTDVYVYVYKYIKK